VHAQASLFAEPLALLQQAITLADAPAEQPPLLGAVVTAHTLQTS
jgi:hypothetical protein